MSSRLHRLALGAAAAAVATAFTPAAFATNGYFQHGVGIKAQGMGGVGIALPQDSIAAASNPAGMAFVGGRVDVGVDWFRPSRSATISGIPNFPSPFPNFNGSFNGDDKKDFFIPEFGYNRMLTPTLALGVTVYGNGGLNTSYTTAIPLLGSSKAGVDLSQLFIAPTVAWKPAPDHAIGFALEIAYQRFKATGLQNFDDPLFSSSPGNVTDRGYDDAAGVGARIGWVGRVLPGLTLGATYQSKTRMSEFDKYKGLFAEQGAFDIPANYGIGLAFKPLPAATVALDVVRIEYEGVAAVSNPLLPNFAQAQLGADGGPGFGWKDVTAYKLGVDYALSPSLTLRAGYNYGEQPIPASETLFNVLAPGVVESHYTLGATFTLASKGELSFAFMYAPEVEVRGTGAIPTGALFGQPLPNGNADIRLKEMSFGIAYGWRF
jgi:long-chain fatty acid transport protein